MKQFLRWLWKRCGWLSVFVVIPTFAEVAYETYLEEKRAGKVLT